MNCSFRRISVKGTGKGKGRGKSKGKRGWQAELCSRYLRYLPKYLRYLPRYGVLGLMIIGSSVGKSGLAMIEKKEIME